MNSNKKYKSDLLSVLSSIPRTEKRHVSIYLKSGKMYVTTWEILDRFASSDDYFFAAPYAGCTDKIERMIHATDVGEIGYNWVLYSVNQT